MQIFSENDKILQSVCATIGVFDGVHIGHRFLLENMQKTAFSSGLKSLVITFENHPQSLFFPQNNFKLLTTEPEKIDLIAELNPDFMLLLNFNKKIAEMTSADFLFFLKKNYSLKKLIIGYNHSFGSDKIKNFEQYKIIGKNLGIDIEHCPSFYITKNQQISSSNIRKFLLNGDVEKAAKMLGKNYSLNGCVKEGEKIGRKIGFPTANLEISPQKLVPASGVYAVEIALKNLIFNGMLYIGNRPTLSGKNQSVEVNIFDFNENIYDEKITVFFKNFIRKDKKFTSLEKLKKQINKDKEKILNLKSNS
jgi:riboflavin kinase/FMN adenylyltransferase